MVYNQIGHINLRGGDVSASSYVYFSIINFDITNLYFRFNTTIHRYEY